MRCMFKNNIDPIKYSFLTMTKLTIPSDTIKKLDNVYERMVFKALHNSQCPDEGRKENPVRPAVAPGPSLF